MNRDDTSLGGAAAGFTETLWQSVRRAADSSPDLRRRGLEELCTRYWKPIYRYIRIAWRKSNEDAKDLTQAFCLWLVEGEAVRKYEAERGGFRAFLKTLIKHFVLHQEEALHRLKRGGGVAIHALDDADAAGDPAGQDPDREFDAAWRVEILSRAVAAVRKRFDADGRKVKFQVFEAYDLGSASGAPTYAELGAKFGIKATDVQNYLAAVREEVRTEIRRELAETTSSREELEEEWNAFFPS